MQPPSTTPEFKANRLTADGWEPEAAKSMATRMPDRQFESTYNSRYQAANPQDAAMRSYDRFNTSATRTFAPLYEDNVQPHVQKALGGLGKVMNSGYVPAAGVGALGGAGIGALLNLIRNTVSGESGGYDKALGLGALAGGGLGALSHSARATMEKQASTDPYTAVMLDPTLSSSEKQAILRAMGRLSSNDVYQLQRLLATATGAGVGAMILRFLTGKGLISTALGAIVGGVIGSGMVSSHKMNSLNQYY